MIQYDLIVVGGGPAGMGAAITAKRKGLEKVLIIEREEELGGLLTNAEYVVCSKTGYTGEAYRMSLIKSVEALGIEVKLKTTVLKIEEDNRVACISNRKRIEKMPAKAVLLASGTKEKKVDPTSIGGDSVTGIYSINKARKMLKEGNELCGKRIFIFGCTELNRIADLLKQHNAQVVGIACNNVDAAAGYHLCSDYYEGYEIAAVYGEERLEEIILYKDGGEVAVQCDTVIMANQLMCDGSLAIKSNMEVNCYDGPKVDEKHQTSRADIYACGRCVKPDMDMEEILMAANEAAVEVIKNR